MNVTFTLAEADARMLLNALADALPANDPVWRELIRQAREQQLALHRSPAPLTARLRP